MKKLRGFTLIELLIVVAIIAILAAIAVPNFLEAQTRSKVSRVRSDHRSLATAIETYYVDNNEYPAHGYQGSQPTFDDSLLPAGYTFSGKTFRRRDDANTVRFNTLTTPIAYVTSIFPDPFADTRGLGFRYFNDGRGWIVGSWGPDTDQASGGDMEWNLGTLPASGGYTNANRTGAVETVYNSTAAAQPSVTLLTSASPAGSLTYDPTNGTISPGDLWRVKQ